jgi:hypothetical protein
MPSVEHPHTPARSESSRQTPDRGTHLASLLVLRAPKTCSRCRRVDPQCGFWRNRVTKDGLAIY